MKTLTDPTTAAALRTRLESITPGHERRWGSMTAQQMLAHLGDAADAVTGKAPFTVPARKPSLFLKFVALRLPVPWPRNLRVGNDPAGVVAAPERFELERTRAIDGLAHLLSAPGSVLAPSHPIFGPMTRTDWMRWAYLHVDHHLRQFGA